MSTNRKPRIEGVDLFCGAGGLTHGLIRGGVAVVAGLDVDPECRVPYESNNSPAKFREADVRKVRGSDLADLYSKGSVRLLAGCAPCQPFSTYSRKGRRVRNDAMWDLVQDFGRLVREFGPDLVTMENVPQLVHHPVFESFLEDLTGYDVWWEVIECAQYGVPQTRKRLVLLASRLGPVSLAPPKLAKAKTVRSAIGKLVPLKAGEADPQDQLHVASRLSALNLRRIRASRPGGTWRDWDASLRATCHAKDSGQTYPSVYGRMEWDKPAPTITTQCFGFGNGRFGHPEQDRAITLREAAILQTFPKGYRFTSRDQRVKFSVMGRLIGNAVPVRIGEAIARSLVAHVASASGKSVVRGGNRRANGSGVNERRAEQPVTLALLGRPRPRTGA
jgi:DNA (cytosine-5)-methyltransferase 1